ncbi:MAG: oligosaccharide flippase family protein [Crocinitomicaceae bacterium]
MSSVKSLLGQTAIYGLPTIVGRLLNYFLVPLYTYFLPLDKYGIISELYAWVAFLIVLLTFGMETAFFKFFNDKTDKDEVFKNSFLTVLGINLLFLLVLLFFNQHIADLLLYSDHNEYIVLLGIIVCIDASSALPMAKLRSENKALKFSLIHFTAIGVNISLNLIFFFFFYNESHPHEGVFFILIANLVSSLVKPIGTYSEFIGLKLKYNAVLAKEMFKYAIPLVIAGFAGIINETLDRVMLKQLLYNRGGLSLKAAEAQLGIYSACYKLAMIVTIFLQAYRYAAEPFFFANAKDENRNKLYAKIMNYFIAFVCLVFIGVALNIDVFKYFIRNEDFWVGLDVVPILLVANVFLGIYFNQSIWYKLSGQTKFGAYIAIGGAAITIAVNLIFIPLYGFYASAWATLIVYGLQMVASYLLGQKYYPIKYNLRKFGLYFGLALTLYFIAYFVNMDANVFTWMKFFFHNSLILLYISVVWFMEKPSKLTVNR